MSDQIPEARPEFESETDGAVLPTPRATIDLNLVHVDGYASFEEAGQLDS
ncbi:hypothetical protein [Streptomyces sp. NPDC101206]